MIPDWDVPDTVQTVIFRTFFGNPLVGKMVVVKVAMVLDKTVDVVPPISVQVVPGISVEAVPLYCSI
jgi:hypothetical protein